MAKKAAPKPRRKSTKRRAPPKRSRAELVPPGVESPYAAAVSVERVDVRPVANLEEMPARDAEVPPPAPAPMLADDPVRTAIAPHWKGIAAIVREGVPVYPSEFAAVTEDGRKKPRRAGLMMSDLAPSDRVKLQDLVIKLKSFGWTYTAIRKATRLDRVEIALVLREARSNKSLNDVLADLDMTCVPQAVDNMRRILQSPNHAKNYDASVKMLEGRGAFLTHQKSQSAVLNQTELRVVIENAPGAPDSGLLAVPIPGTIVGTPRSE